jgi:hypothetical protein
MKNISSIILLSIVLLMFGCNASKKKYETEIEELNNIIITLNEEIQTLNMLYNDTLLLYNNTFREEGSNNFPIPETYEEALDLMNRLQIENVVLERIIINNEIHTVVEVRESGLFVSSDSDIVEAYDIPDISGNVIFSVVTPKKEIYVTNIAIVEEPYITRNGSNDNWVKIRIDDGRIGWIKGEYTGLNRGGIKYETRRNIWLEQNYASHWR